MKNITRLLIAGLTLLSSSAWAQVDFKQQELVKSNKFINIKEATSVATVPTGGSRSTACVDTSYYPLTKADSLFIYTIDPDKSSGGDYEVVQVYKNSSEIQVYGVYAYTDTFTVADIIAYVYSVDENGDPDQVLGSQTVSTLSVGDELEMYIEFDTPVEVTEDFAVGFGLGKTSAEEFNVLFDFNSGRDEGLAILRQPGDESWLVISPDSIASKFNVSASEVEDNFDFMIFPVFATDLSAEYTASATDLSQVELGTTVTFTSTINAPNNDDSTITYNSFARRPSNFSWYVIAAGDTSFLEGNDTLANYSYTFDSLGTYWVELIAAQAKWSIITTGTYKECFDLAHNEITVVEEGSVDTTDNTDNTDDTDTISAIEELSSNMTLYTAYPNPASSLVTINFDLNSSEATALKIYNLEGQLVHSFDANLFQGKHKLVVNTSNLSNGTYFYTVTTQNAVMNSSFMIQK